MAYFIWDIIYIGQVVATYIYIFIKYKKHRKLNKDQNVKSSDREHFKLLLPTLTIVTFLIFFFCIPDVVNFIFQFHYLDQEIVFNLLGIFYRIAWLADPIIYIYNCKILSKSKRKYQPKNTATRSNESNKL